MENAFNETWSMTWLCRVWRCVLCDCVICCALNWSQLSRFTRFQFSRISWLCVTMADGHHCATMRTAVLRLHYSFFFVVYERQFCRRRSTVVSCGRVDENVGNFSSRTHFPLFHFHSCHLRGNYSLDNRRNKFLPFSFAHCSHQSNDFFSFNVSLS